MVFCLAYRRRPDCTLQSMTAYPVRCRVPHRGPRSLSQAIMPTSVTYAASATALVRAKPKLKAVPVFLALILMPVLTRSGASACSTQTNICPVETFHPHDEEVGETGHVYMMILTSTPYFCKHFQEDGCVSKWRQSLPSRLMNLAPERSSPGRIRNPPGKIEKRPTLNHALTCSDNECGSK